MGSQNLGGDDGGSFLSLRELATLLSGDLSTSLVSLEGVDEPKYTNTRLLTSRIDYGGVTSTKHLKTDMDRGLSRLKTRKNTTVNEDDESSSNCDSSIWTSTSTRSNQSIGTEGSDSSPTQIKKSRR